MSQVSLAMARVVETRRLMPDTQLTWFHAPELTKGAYPGQFLMLRCRADDAVPTFDPLLPRPMSYHRVRQGKDGLEFALMYRLVGRGTQWLASQPVGAEVFAWGPLGKGFEIKPNTQNVLVLGGGMGVAPIVWLVDDAVAQGKSVTLLTGARTAEGVYPASLLPPEVEVVVATDDGSAGRRGLVTNLLEEYLPWADQIFACGPKSMFETMAAVMKRARSRKPAQVLMEERMGCGTGICYGCAIETRRGVKLCCKDGPRFELRDVFP